MGEEEQKGVRTPGVGERVKDWGRKERDRGKKLIMNGKREKKPTR